MNLTDRSEPDLARTSLSISIVVFRPDLEMLARTMFSLDVACKRLRGAKPNVVLQVHLIDNGGLPSDFAARWASEVSPCFSYTVKTGHGNIGYGRGHNLAIATLDSDYHLILNPDIEMQSDALVEALDFLSAHLDIGAISPRIDDGETLQYLCRRYPALIDLFIRGFMPARIRELFRRRLAWYEMRDVINERDAVFDPPIISGCYMLYRTDLLRRLNGFDARYFLYFEDYDLSLRTHTYARIAYVPRVRVSHHGGGAARKGRAHIRMFMASAIKFYNRFGWKLL